MESLPATTPTTLPVDMYLCNKPVYFKEVKGLFLRDIQITLPEITPETSAQVLSYKVSE
jgi:hypothetical protein